MAATLKDVRCPQCRILLCRMDDDALKPGKRVEWKCPRCNGISYRIGTDQKPREAPRHCAGDAPPAAGAEAGWSITT